MGGGRPRTSTNPTPRRQHAPHQPSPLRPLSVIPAQAGTNAPTQHPSPHSSLHLTRTLPPSPIHPSPLPGGRLGGGWEAANQHQPHATPPARTPPTPRPPSSPRALPVIPAQAGTHAPTPSTPLTPLPNSSLPPSRGEARWGVGGREPAPTPRHAANTHPTNPTPRRQHAPHQPSASVIPAPPHRHPLRPLNRHPLRPPSRHSCAGRNPLRATRPSVALARSCSDPSRQSRRRS